MAKIFNRKPLKEERRRLRANLTKSEARLWTALKGKQLQGRKFRRQHSIGAYIVDFYCPGEKLVIELDGSQHSSHSGYVQDLERDEYLKELGIRVLRFRNHDLINSMDVVLEEIASSFSK